MGRLIRIFIFTAAFLAASVLGAQDRSVTMPDDFYRPIYGYVIDTCTNKPVTRVQVYGFESMEDAMRGKKAVEEKRNPLKISLKGDIVVAEVDATGRYMIPAMGKGVLLFHFKDSGRMLFEEVRGRTEVSLGRKVEEKDFHIDLSAYDAEVRRRERDRKPAGIKVDMDFNARFPALGKAASGCRIYVERHIHDLETDKVLDVRVPVVRDGKAYHRKFRDSLSALAGNLPYLNDTTHIIRVRDNVDAEAWKDRCFRLDYLVMMDDGVQLKAIDTLHMLTNRVGRPMRFLEYSFRPYEVAPGEDSPAVLPVKRKLTVRGVFEGYVPEILLDPAYILTGIHVKSTAAPMKSYAQNMASADSSMQAAMAVIRDSFSAKTGPDVRIIRMSEVVRWNDVADALSASGTIADDIRKAVRRHPDDVDAQTAEISSLKSYRDVVLPYVSSLEKVEYRYEFLTSRRFSRKDYLDRFSKAEGEDLRILCRRAIEESELLECEPWVYASNLLASDCIDSGTPDCSILEPYLESFPDGDDIQCEVVANQVMMLMSAGRFDEAGALAAHLPERFRHLRAIASCKSGTVPSSPEEIEVVASSSPRNRVIMDMCCGTVDEGTFKTLDALPEDDAVAWYLKACCLCILYGNDMADLTTERYAGSSRTAYEDVKAFLEEAFRLDSGLADAAVLDGDINEYALKEVLGVFIL